MYMVGDEQPTKTSEKDLIKTELKSKILPAKLHALVLIVLTSLGAGFAGGWLGSTYRQQNPLLDSKDTQFQQQLVLNESQLISEIAKTVGPSVVSVNVLSDRDDFFGFGPLSQESAGTGIILSSGGIIITNRHVVPRTTTSISVTLVDGTTLEDVQIVGRTNESDPLDIAFLKITNSKGKELKPAKLGDSSKVQVGDRVVAIGNALGQFQNTVTSGIISGYGRSVIAGDETGSEALQNLFQTDTAINQGNSGGPLVNISGEVIAINTAVAGGAENIGFAIPINDISGIIKSVLEKGKIIRPYLGIRYIALTDDIAFQLDIATKRGAYIVSDEQSDEVAILPSSPAAKAGLMERDIIIKINDIAIDEKNSLVSVLGRFSVDETVTLTVVRGGNEIKVDVKLEAAPQN